MQQSWTPLLLQLHSILQHPQLPHPSQMHQLMLNLYQQMLTLAHQQHVAPTSLAWLVQQQQQLQPKQQKQKQAHKQQHRCPTLGLQQQHLHPPLQQTAPRLCLPLPQLLTPRQQKLHRSSPPQAPSQQMAALAAMQQTKRQLLRKMAAHHLMVMMSSSWRMGPMQQLPPSPSKTSSRLSHQRRMLLQHQQQARCCVRLCGRAALKWSRWSGRGARQR